MKSYIASFCDEFAYPLEAKESLLQTFTKLEEHPEAFNKFQRDINLYYQNRLVDTKDYSELLANLDEAAVLAQVHKYSVHLLFLISLSKHTRTLYQEQNISDKVFYDSMCDLKWKLFECHKMHGVWGNFVAFWDMGFFFLKLFALGRLQFEIDQFKGSYEKEGYQLKEGDKVVNLHIPSCGSLKHEDCVDSYRQAKEFFQKHFEGDVIPFVCHSWLLFPDNRVILPSSSNILTFMNDFDIINTTIDDEGQDLWRIYYSDYKKDTKDLPRDTSLQAAYRDWLMKGNKVGLGYGVFFF